MLFNNNNLNKNAITLLYRIINDLLYFNDNKKGLRLCILTAIEAKIFKLTYNKIGHPGYGRTYKRLTDRLYLYNIWKKLHEVIRYYPYY